MYVGLSSPTVSNVGLGKLSNSNLSRRFRSLDTRARHPYIVEKCFCFPQLREAMSTKYVYYFGDGKADGSAEMRNLLGGKGANLHEMTRLGLPVPAGFTLSTDVCTYFYSHGLQYPLELRDHVAEALRKIEQSVGAKFGDSTNPLLLSCRSGASDSMPGMMDTVLNIGLNDTTVQGVAKQFGHERF